MLDMAELTERTSNINTVIFNVTIYFVINLTDDVFSGNFLPLYRTSAVTLINDRQSLVPVKRA